MSLYCVTHVNNVRMNTGLGLRASSTAFPSAGELTPLGRVLESRALSYPTLERALARRTCVSLGDRL